MIGRTEFLDARDLMAKLEVVERQIEAARVDFRIKVELEGQKLDVDVVHIVKRTVRAALAEQRDKIVADLLQLGVDVRPPDALAGEGTAG